MSLFRTTAGRVTGRATCTAMLCIGLAGLTAAPALADRPLSAGTVASAKVDAELAVCPGQTFSQPFEAWGDTSFYTLVPGSEYNSPGEGWELHGGAQIVEAHRPNGGSGGVLDMPSGSLAVSPPVCVTLHYPTARAWVEDVKGASGVVVGVYYAGGRFGGTGQPVGQLSSIPNHGWQLSSPFEVRPALGGSAEGVREVRFVYANTSRNGDVHLSGLYVDPRMS
jgi:hypothetical protein